MNQFESVQTIRLKERLYQKAALEGIPLSVTFELSPLCNFNCRMCYIHQTETQVSHHERPGMNLAEWIQLAEQLKKEGTLYILLTGGEPLLWPEFRTLYRKLYSMGFLVSVNTNGSLIDQDIISLFTEMPPNRINLTLYGASDGTYKKLCGTAEAYSKVVKAIEVLQQAGIFVKLNCSVTPDNASDLTNILDFANTHKLMIETSTYMFPPVRKNSEMIGKNARFTPEEAAFYRLVIARHQLNEQNYHHYLANLLNGSAAPIGLSDECIDPTSGKMRCMAGKASLWVTWDGYLALCGMMPDYKVDLRKEDLSTGWKNLKSLTERLPVSGVCSQCSNIEICHSCAAMSYAETGKTDQTPVYLCRMMEELRKLAQKELKQ